MTKVLRDTVFHEAGVFRAVWKRRTVPVLSPSNSFAADHSHITRAKPPTGNSRLRQLANYPADVGAALLGAQDPQRAGQAADEPGEGGKRRPAGGLAGSDEAGGGVGFPALPKRMGPAGALAPKGCSSVRSLAADCTETQSWKA